MMQYSPPSVAEMCGATDARTIAVSTRGLSKQFKRRWAVDKVDLTVYQGDVYGLLGPNGAGKTTLIAMLLGLVFPTAGQRSIYGCDVATHRLPALRHVGAMIEDPAFYPYLSGWDNVRLLGGLRGAVSPQRIAEVLRTVGLDQRARDPYRTYSLGMKQRLAIGLALLHDPRILLLDEPTNGLDPQGIADIRSVIGHLATLGKTIILCTHLLHEVELVCNRVAIMRSGRLVTEGNLDTLDVAHDFESTFLSLTKG